MYKRNTVIQFDIQHGKEDGMETTTSMATRVPKDVMERYTKLAQGTGRPRSYYVNEALATSIDRLEWEYGILKKAEDLRAGRAKTYTPDEVRELCGLDS